MATHVLFDRSQMMTSTNRGIPTGDLWVYNTERSQGEGREGEGGEEKMRKKRPLLSRIAAEGGPFTV